MKIFLLFLLSLTAGTSLYAQHWISNRFAQNCAACHTPGRLNVPAAERRCTLSCQGCHVNPNGGGLRNRYGVWNEQRWLRSSIVDFLGHKALPAPLSNQKFASNGAVSLESRLKAQAQGSHSVGEPPLVVTKNLDYAEKNYDKYADKNWLRTARDKNEFLSTITNVDPYREERRMSVQGGADLRYFLWKRGETLSDGTYRYFLMSVDVGLRFRPVPENVSLVVEARSLNQPSNANLIQGFTTETRMRSAYVLVDDLSYNSYLMYGIYRPMFGLYDPDHTTLSQTISGLTTRSTFNSIGFGAAPNIPFANVNILVRPPDGSLEPARGYVVTVGGRWVTAGLSLMGSYWKTKSDASGEDLQKTMWSVTGGASVADFTANFEYLYIDQEYAAGLNDAGAVWTTQFKYRFWRENYLMFNYANSNIAPNRKAGSGTEWLVGVKSYPFSGLELELVYSNKRTDTEGVERKDAGIQLQGHLFI